jgi:hypothetical protein
LNKHRKVQAIERGLFALLLVVMGAAGATYELLREAMPSWDLVAYIGGGLVASYLAYRAALTLALRRLTR